jgi:hypothetical protein
VVGLRRRINRIRHQIREATRKIELAHAARVADGARFSEVCRARSGGLQPPCPSPAPFFTAKLRDVTRPADAGSISSRPAGNSPSVDILSRSTLKSRLRYSVVEKVRLARFASGFCL